LIHLDTNVVTRLVYGKLRELSPKIKRLLETEPLSISPLVVLELEYLYRKSAIRDDGVTIREKLAKDLEVGISKATLADVTEAALPLHWTREPFDRLIVANAIVDRARLVTSDQLILANYSRAVW
jgi:PIN domain nuclease of toxin-antitoxin system